MSVVASRYSEALFELAVEEKCLEDIHDAFDVVSGLFNDNTDLVDILSHPEIMMEEKTSIVKDLFETININFVNFICILIEKNRIKEFFNIKEDFEVLYNAHLNIIVAKVYSVELLNEKQIKDLTEKLCTKLNKKITIKNIVDKSLIGGIKIKIDNHVIDYSIQSKINDLSDELHKIQIR